MEAENKWKIAFSVAKVKLNYLKPWIIFEDGCTNKAAVMNQYVTFNEYIFSGTF